MMVQYLFKFFSCFQAYYTKTNLKENGRYIGGQDLWKSLGVLASKRMFCELKKSCMIGLLAKVILRSHVVDTNV
jgi:hypothetical protein